MFLWAIFILVILEFFWILILQKEEPKRFKKYIEKERKFIGKMITFDCKERRN